MSGISKVDCREPPSAVESVPAPTATTSQAAITHQRKRATNRPSRYRYVDTVCHPPGHPRPCSSEEHTSELQSLMRISFPVFFLDKTNNNIPTYTTLVFETR